MSSDHSLRQKDRVSAAGEQPEAVAWAGEWAKKERRWRDFQVQPITGDASTRQYLRLVGRTSAGEGDSLILMISPPQNEEKNPEFCSISALLCSLGVLAPRVYSWQQARGWLLMVDFGHRLLYDILRDGGPDERDGLYKKALEVILTMQSCPGRQLKGLEVFSAERARREAMLFKSWYLERLLGEECAHPEAFEEAVAQLSVAVSDQPRVLVHFDFHSRNLLPTAAGELAVIDVQDAVAGPVGLDPVSLLRDCYLELPKQQVAELLEYYRHRAIETGILSPQIDAATLSDWFEQCGLQRHLRVLGTFARLHLKDGRDGYLKDLPLTLRYALRAAAGLPGMRAVERVLLDSEPVLHGFLAGR